MNLVIKKAGQADKVVAVTLGNLIFDTNRRLSLEVKAPNNKTYLVPLILGPVPHGAEEPE